jgi:hypothetical protein
VTVTRREVFSDTPSPFVENNAPMAARVRADGEIVSVDAGGIRAEIHPENGSLRFFDASGRVILAEGAEKTLEAFEAKRIARGVKAQAEEIHTENVPHNRPQDKRAGQNYDLVYGSPYNILFCIFYHVILHNLPPHPLRTVIDIFLYVSF